MQPPIRKLGVRHDVLAIEIVDPRELELPDVGVLTLADPETGALHEVHALASHPRIQSLSFGLMDFVSAHRGAIPASGMSVKGQFEHPLVVRAKLEIALARGKKEWDKRHALKEKQDNREALRALRARNRRAGVV